MSMIAKSTAYEAAEGSTTLYSLSDKEGEVSEARAAKLKGWCVVTAEASSVVTIEDGNGNIIGSAGGGADVTTSFMVPQGVEGGEDFINVSSGKIVAHVRHGKATVTAFIVE